MQAKKIVISVVLGSFLLAGCSNLNSTEQRTITGGAIGSAAGLGVAAVTGGSLLAGGLIGAAAGAGAGYVYDRVQH